MVGRSNASIANELFPTDTAVVPDISRIYEVLELAPDDTGAHLGVQAVPRYLNPA